MIYDKRMSAITAEFLYFIIGILTSLNSATAQRLFARRYRPATINPLVPGFCKDLIDTLRSTRT